MAPRALVLDLAMATLSGLDCSATLGDQRARAGPALAPCTQAIDGELSDDVTAGARQNGRSWNLCGANRWRYSHAVNTERVRNWVWAPLSITNKSRKYLILGL